MNDTSFRQQVDAAIVGFEEHFNNGCMDEFVELFQQRSAESGKVLTYFLHLSLDEGPELEVGFLTAAMIIDITLSKGKVYSHSMRLETVTKVEVVETPVKWTLFIYGEKRFDYNVIKSESPVALFEFHDQLKAILPRRNADASF